MSLRVGHSPSGFKRSDLELPLFLVFALLASQCRKPVLSREDDVEFVYSPTRLHSSN